MSINYRKYFQWYETREKETEMVLRNRKSLKKLPFQQNDLGLVI